MTEGTISFSGTYRRAMEIRAELKIPKNRTPVLPAGVPRLYEG